MRHLARSSGSQHIAMRHTVLRDMQPRQVMIPGHTDLWRSVELRQRNRPLAERDLLAVFHGRHGGIAESYAAVAVRTRLLAAPWANASDV